MGRHREHGHGVGPEACTDQAQWAGRGAAATFARTSAYNGPRALYGARSPTGATAPKSRLRPRYARAVPFIDRCRECPYQGKAIGPRGNDASRFILVGEAPGATEID